jgi:hypothetical protein
MKPILER